jgi:putative peptidoglycan lipid II flippase
LPVQGPASETPPAGAGLARSAGLAGSATLASRLLGLVRETLLAAYFGAGDAMDAYYVAFRIPNLVRDLFAEGAMNAAFVPTFTHRLVRDGRESAWHLGNSVFNVLAVVTLALVAGGIVFAVPLVRLYAGDYASVPGKLELTIHLARIMLPFLMTVAIAAAAMGMLNSLHHYFVPALSPTMFNVAVIGCVVLLVPVMPALGWPPVTALAIGVVVGGVGQVAIQWPSLRREGFRYRPFVDLRDPDLRRVLILMGPGVIGVAATQVNLLVATRLATSQGTGAASWLGYAFRLIYLPIGIFGVSIATAVLPAVSRHAVDGNRDGVRSTLSRGLRLMLMLNVPATAGLMVLATPIVRLLFQHGHFLASDTAATAAALRLYALGLIGYSTVRITSPAFYALGKSRIPVASSMVAIATNLVLSLWLIGAYGFLALALATSVAALVNAAMLTGLMRRELEGLDGRRIAAAVLKIGTATVAMAGAAAVANRVLTGILPSPGVMTQAVRLAGSIGLALAVLAATARLLRLAEFDDALRAVGTWMESRRRAAG